MKNLVTLVLVLAVTACGSPYNVKYADNIYCPADSKERATFILECVKNANPMSDEEPEDYIYQCNVTSKELFCETKTELSLFTQGSSYTPIRKATQAEIALYYSEGVTVE